MSELFAIRPPAEGEEIEVCNLVARSFNEFIAPEFSEEGVLEFYKYANPRAFLRRLESGYFALVAEAKNKIAGVIEIKGKSHLSMLYVEKAYHHKGIARELIKAVLEEREMYSDITVNSSKYAVPFYESLGFIQIEDEKTICGVIHVPMMVSTPLLKESVS